MSTIEEKEKEAEKLELPSLLKRYKLILQEYWRADEEGEDALAAELNEWVLVFESAMDKKVHNG